MPDGTLGSRENPADVDWTIGAMHKLAYKRGLIPKDEGAPPPPEATIEKTHLSLERLFNGQKIAPPTPPASQGVDGTAGDEEYDVQLDDDSDEGTATEGSNPPNTAQGAISADLQEPAPTLAVGAEENELDIDVEVVDDKDDKDEKGEKGEEVAA